MPDTQQPPQPQPQPSDQPLPANSIGALVSGLKTLTSLRLDQLLVLFVCGGFGFLLWEDKRTQAERNAHQLRAFEDSRENDRRFHSEQREKDRTFYARERELDRTALGALALKIERVETSIWKWKAQPADDNEEAIAPMPRCKGDSAGG